MTSHRFSNWLARMALIVLVAGLGAPGIAAAQDASDNAAKPSYDALADLLENEESRTRLIDQLRTLSAEEQAPASADKTSAGTRDTAAADTETAADDPPPSFARRMANSTQAFAEGIGDKVSNAVAAFGVGTDEAPAAAAFDPAAFAKAATTLALVAATTVVLFFVLRALAAPVFTRAGNWAANGSGGASKVLRRTVAVASSLFLDILVILLACAGGYALALFAFGEAGAIGTRESLFINAFAMIEIFKALIRMVFASRYEGLRLFPISDSVAAWWSLRLRWLSGLIGYALLVAVPILNVEVSRAVGAMTSLLVMLIAYVYALRVIFSNRQTIAERLQTNAGQADNAVLGIALRVLGRTWHLLALAYFTLLLVASQVAPEDALPYMAKATLQTLLAVGIGVLVSAAVAEVLGRRLHIGERLRRRMPALEDRLNTYVPSVLKTVRIAVLTLIAVVVIDAWQVFDFGGWLTSGAGEAFLAGLIHVGLILLVALGIWTVCASIMEAKMQAPDATSRTVTLMLLFRNALAIVIGTFTFMIVLSQVGVNIGPLIAGAGVLGLAIGFGAQKMVQDVITGVFIQIENAMNTGDVVTVAGVSGTAEKLSIRSVGIRDLSGTYHVIPFSSVDLVSNYMRDFAYHVGEYGISYRESIDDAVVHLRAAFEDLKADETHGPNVIDDITIAGVTALADSSVNIRVMIKTKPGTQWGVGRAYNRLVKIHFDGAGIEIPFPHTTLYFGEDKDGSASAANVRLTSGNVIEGRTSGARSDPRATDTDQPRRDVEDSDDPPG